MEIGVDPPPSAERRRSPISPRADAGASASASERRLRADHAAHRRLPETPVSLERA
jgi:hypothetical protein